MHQVDKCRSDFFFLRRPFVEGDQVTAGIFDRQRMEYSAGNQRLGNGAACARMDHVVAGNDDGWNRDGLQLSCCDAQNWKIYPLDKAIAPKLHDIDTAIDVHRQQQLSVLDSVRRTSDSRPPR